MSDDKEGKLFDGGFLRISTIVVLLVLLVIWGLLAFQNWRLLQELAFATQPVVEPAPPQNIVPPAPDPVPAVVKKPAPPAAPKPPSTTTAKRNYTQPEQNLAPPVSVKSDSAPAPVARVVPTDV